MMRIWRSAFGNWRKRILNGKIKKRVFIFPNDENFHDLMKWSNKHHFHFSLFSLTWIKLCIVKIKSVVPQVLWNIKLQASLTMLLRQCVTESMRIYSLQHVLYDEVDSLQTMNFISVAAHTAKWTDGWGQYKDGIYQTVQASITPLPKFWKW